MREKASILHADLDAYFASVEQLHEPSLRGKPVIVGGLGPRGVVAAASYEARAFGVRSAMPMTRARRLCPHAAFRSPRFEEYVRLSGEVQDIFRSFTPLVEPLALDEAFLDVAGAERLLGDGRAIAEAIRVRVFEETGLVISVGVATTKFVAKLACAAAKPDGLLAIEPGEELAFLHPLPVERLWGVGPKTLRRLARFGVVTIGDLAGMPVETLSGALGSAAAAHLHALCWNDDGRDVQVGRAAKSVGQEETFIRDLDDREQVRREVLRLGDRVATRLRAAGVAGRTVTLKLRFGDFRTVTRSVTFPEATSSSTAIGAAAAALLACVDLAPGIRLAGVSLTKLEARDPYAQSAGRESGVQGELRFSDDDPTRTSGEAGQPDRRRSVEEAMDAVRQRFGDEAVGRAVFVENEGLRVGRRGTAWGPADHEDLGRFSEREVGSP